MNKLQNKIILVLMVLYFSGCNDDRGIPTPVEQERPVFVELDSPKDSTFAFDIDGSIVMTFSEPMNPESFPDNFDLWLDEAKTESVPGTFTSGGSNIIFTPDEPLQQVHQYFTEIRGRVQDVNGNGIDKDSIYVFSSEFFTEGPSFSDVIPEYYVATGSEDKLLKVSLENDLLKTTSTLPLDDFGRQLEMAFTVDGSKLLITDYNTSGSGIHFVDMNTFSVTKVLNENPDGSAINKSAEIVVSNSTAYVVNQSSKILSVVDIASETITSTIELAGTPKGLAITPEFTKVFVGSADSDEIWVINTSTNTVENTYHVNEMAGTIRLVVSSDGSTLIVRESRSQLVQFVSVADGSLIGSVDVGYESRNGNNNDLATAGDYVYVSSSFGNLTKIEISTRTIVNEIIHDNIQGIEIYPTSELLLATVREGEGYLLVIKPETMKIIRKVSLDNTTPWDVVIRPSL